MAVKRQPTGDSGLSDFSNNSNRDVEYLFELQRRQGSIKYREMAKSDTQIGMILRVHKNPIRSASWSIATPDDATDEEKRAIDLINCWFFKDYSVNFDTLLGQVLSFLEYGFSVFERVWTPYRYEEELYLLPQLQQRLQTSIEDIFPDKNIIRQNTIAKGTVDIDMDDLVFFTLNRQGEDLRGESILRTSYKIWKRKNVYEELMGIGIQRNSSGIPWMKVPKGTRVESSEYIAVEQLLQNMVVHENAYMIFEDGYEFGTTMSNFNPDNLQRVIDACDSKMAMSVLAQFVLLGQQGNTGAYALSRDQSDFFLDGLSYVINLIEGVFNRSVIIPILDLNFGDTIDPKRVVLKGKNLNKKAGQELANVLQQLASNRFIKPTVDDEIQLRESLELPELTEDEIEQRREQQDNPPQFGNPNDPNNPYPDPNALPNDNNTKGKDSGEDDQQDNEDDGKKKLVNKIHINKKLIKFAEQRLKGRKQLLDNMNKEMTDFMRSNLLAIKDKLMADIEATLNRGTVSVQGLKAIDVSYKRYLESLEKKLAGMALDGWNEAKRNAKANNIKLAESMNPRDLPDKALAQYILNQAQSVVDLQTSKMKNNAITGASNSMLRGFSVNQTMSNIEKILSNYIDGRDVDLSGSLVVVESFNFGMNQFNKEIGDQLWGYVFVAVDDDRTSEICEFYNGKTYSVDSTELSIVTPPLHPNCRSSLEPIYRSQEKPEKIDDVIAPPSIQKDRTIY